MSRSNVYMDIKIGDEKVGRIVIELFDDKAPKSSKNFYHLCKGDAQIGSRQLWYKNNYFHRVIQSFMVQAGDIIYGSKGPEKSDDIGKGGCSIFGKKDELDLDSTLETVGGVRCCGIFEDENLGDFTEPFMVAMANMGEADTNSSQFFITTCSSPHLNNKHSVIGRVVYGKSVVRSIEHTAVDSDGFPTTPVLIEDCGEWNETLGIPLYNASNNTIGGDVFEEYPDDDLNFDKDSAEKAYEASCIIKDSGSLLFKSKDYQNAYFKYRKALKYVNEFIPDIDMDKVFYEKFTELKAKLYLNLILVMFNQKKYEDAIKYSVYLLEIPEASGLDRAKAYYRSGNCHLMKKRFDKALADFNACKEHNPNDEAVDKKIGEAQNKLEESKERTRKSIAKFFS
ncbi:Peptidyl-prolyl cis-trans isomerase CYP7 [Lachancea thermotolerans]